MTEDSPGPPPSRAKISPIRKDDLPRVGDFLFEQFRHEAMIDSISAERWARNIRGPWGPSDGSHGFQLRDDGRVVGVYVAYYSPPRTTSVGRRRFCNFADWAVADEYRPQSLLLAMKLLGERGFVQTDFTARPEVARINRRLGFTEIPTRPYLVMNVPWRGLRGTRILSRHEDIAATLADDDLVHYQDHRGIEGLEQVAAVVDGRSCHIVYRRRRVPLKSLGGRSLPVACILHVSNKEVFARSQSAVSRELLRRGLPLTWSELHVTGHWPPGARPSQVFASPRMYRGEDVSPSDVDYLYSELMFG